MASGLPQPSEASVTVSGRPDRSSVGYRRAASGPGASTAGAGPQQLAWAGCLAGALDESDYLSKIRTAGFERVEVLSHDYADISDADLEDAPIVVVNAEGEAVTGQDAKTLLQQSGLSARDLAHKVASVKVRAYKPA